MSNIAGVSGNSITTDFCSAQKTAFGDDDVFAEKGGLAGVSTALATGMVLTLSRKRPKQYRASVSLTVVSVG